MKQRKPKGAPDNVFENLNVKFDASRLPMKDLKAIHKWLGRYIEYWKGVK